MRERRREHVAALDDMTLGLLFLRPPASLMAGIPADAVIGLYRAMPFEAPTASYAKFFLEAGHTLALPRFATRDAPMEFAAFTDPFDESDLENGPFGLMQPPATAEILVPDVLFVPLLAFNAEGDRLGQGAGHYDRWLAEHPNASAYGMAWDVQLEETLPTEPHDVPLEAVITPTRLYGAV